MAEYTFIVVKLQVPEEIQNDHEAIDTWLENLEYEFQDLSGLTESSHPSFPGMVQSEIVENQFPFETGINL